MKQNTIDTIEQSVGFAQSVAFAVPEIGPVLAAGISGFDFLFNLIAHPDAPAPSAVPPPLTRVDLQEFIDQFEIALDRRSMQDALDLVDTMHGNLLTHWSILEKDMTSWDATRLKDLGTNVGWEQMIRQDQNDFTSTKNPMTLVITKCKELRDKEYTLPIYVHAVNAYILMAKVCIVVEYGLLQLNHDLQQAQANLDAKIADADKKSSGADTRTSLSSGVLAALHAGKVNPTDKAAKVPEEVVKAAIDVIEKMPTQDIAANTSTYVAQLKAVITDCSDHLRSLIEVTPATYRAFYDLMQIVQSNIEVSHDKARKITRIKPPGIAADYRLDGKNQFLQDWTFAWVNHEYFDHAKEITIDADGVIDMTASERAVMRKAEKLYGDMAINTTTALVGYQKAEDKDIRPDLNRALNNLF